MRATAFAAALETLGVRATVEEQGKLAVLIPTNEVPLDAKSRRAIVALARTFGFANVCIELSAADAALSGD